MQMINDMSDNKNFKSFIKLWEGAITGEAFFLPVIGPVYSAGRPLGGILNDILKNAENNKFLDYDKNRRWFDYKEEIIPIKYLIAGEGWAMVPVLKKDYLDIYYFSVVPAAAKDLEKARALSKGLINEYRVNKVFLHFNRRPRINRNFLRSQIFIKKFISKDPHYNAPENIRLLAELGGSALAKIGQLGREKEMEGFAALAARYQEKGLPRAPVYCAIEDGAIIGAIGPVEATEDAWGTKFFAPPFFGVISSKRKQGIGGRIWRAAEEKAIDLGAKYTLVQNDPDSPAAIFYQSAGFCPATGRYILKI